MVESFTAGLAPPLSREIRRPGARKLIDGAPAEGEEMIVVIDTNIWKAHRFLFGGAGAALRFYLKQKNAQLGMPEILRLEIEHHLRRDLNGRVARLNEDYAALLAVFGSLKQLVLPKEAEIDAAVAKAISSLGVPVLDVPFGFESAKDSAMRTIYGTSPSSQGSQQFKDGVIWADCVKLLEKDEVFLLSNDKAFYESGDYRKGLAKALAQEIESAKSKLAVKPELRDLLDEVRSKITLDGSALADAWLQKEGKSLHAMLERNEFKLDRLADASCDLFVTENPSVLALEFVLSFICVDVSSRGRDNGVVQVRGDGSYNSDDGTFFDLGELGTELRYVDELGMPQSRANAVGRFGPITLGHANVRYSLREKID